ncbi:hypothetical protein AMTRI_Chr08g202870 [Amborella trichopoda]
MEIGLERDVGSKKWVYDSSVDYHCRIPLRASTGGWKAALFIIGIEFSERLSYFGIASNLITYLTKILHQEVKVAAKNVNNWLGVTTVMPLVGGFLADSYMGRFPIILISSIIYLAGLSLLTLSEFLPALKPATCTTQPCTHNPMRAHEVAFFVAIYLVSLGTGGHKPSLESFGADQFDEQHTEERKQKISFFNWWYFGLCSGVILGVTVVVYVQDYVSWGMAQSILTAALALAIILLLLGTPYYRYMVPKGSPLTPMLQVFVAAMAKRKLPLPSNACELYEAPKSGKLGDRILCHTNKFRFLDKAAILEADGKESQSTMYKNPWRLATVTQVEETKLILSLTPIWLSCLIFGICINQGITFFIKQGSTMDRKMGPHFEMPPASLFGFSAFFMVILISIYDKILVPSIRRVTGNERGISILQRIGIGMFFSVVCMITAALTERKRLNIAKKHTKLGSLNGPLPMSVFWLLPQFLLIGVTDVFTLVGLQEYFYDQVPDNMRSLGIALYLSVIGVSSFLSSLLISIVDKITTGRGHPWFAKSINGSRLDLFYWLLGTMGALNLGIYMYVASKYSYKNVGKRVATEDSCNGEVADLGA